MTINTNINNNNDNNDNNNDNDTLRFSDLSVIDNINDEIRMVEEEESVYTIGSRPIHMSVRNECTVPDTMTEEDRLAYVCMLVVLNNAGSTGLSAALEEAEDRILWLSLVGAT